VTEYTYAEHLLQTYTLEEILELNGKTEDEALEFMLEAKFLDTPDPKPVDIYD